MIKKIKDWSNKEISKTKAYIIIGITVMAVIFLWIWTAARQGVDMNIIWGVEAFINASGSTNPVLIAPMEVWKDVRLSEPTMSFKHMAGTVDITHKGNIFTKIPSNWYLIEH